MSKVRAGNAFIVIEVLDKTQAGLKGIQSKFAMAAAKVSQLGRDMMMKSIATLTPGAIGLKVFSDFDDQMRRVQARTKSTAKEVQGLREQAKQLGATTASTATQVATLMAQLARMGFTVSDIENMTNAVRDFSQAAGEGDAQDAAEAER